jgi:hypothetical protein
MNFEDLVRCVLSESPITDVQLDSEIHPERELTIPAKDIAVDYKLIRDKRYRERLQAETAKNIPFNIKIVFRDTVHFGFDTEPTPGVITFVTKPTGDPMILSSKKWGVWMIGHKIGHALQAGRAKMVVTDYGVYEDTLFNNIAREISSSIMWGYDIIPLKRYKNNLDHEARRKLKSMSGFKSVQQGTVQSGLEYVYDLVAQYVMFGKVTFRVGEIFRTQEDADAASKAVTDVIVKRMNEAVGKVLYDTIE